MEGRSALPESRLLSLVGSGQTLRFVWTRAEDGRFRMSLEGVAEDHREGQVLGERIGAFLALMEDDGLEFTERRGTENGAEGETLWMEIQPEIREFPVEGNGALGFGTAGMSLDQMKLPALDPVRAPDLSGYFLDLVALSEEVQEVCICMTREELSPEQEQILNRNLKLSFSEVLAVSASVQEPEDVQRFLALWLVRRRGWRLQVLARVDAGQHRPDVALELLGREWFGTECRVMPAQQDAGHTLLDLSRSFPDGWTLPRLFPEVFPSDRLEVESGMNARLPPLPADGVVIGEVSGRTVRMPDQCREQHTYILGATGTGKSTMLKRLIRHDLAGDDAVVVLDPHGDLFEEVLEALPRHRKKDALILNPRSPGRIPGFNLLADSGTGREKRQRVDFLIGELLHIFRQLWADNPEAFGPMFELYFRNAFLLLAHQPKNQSLGDFDRVLADNKFRAELLSTCDQPHVVRFWNETAVKAGGDATLANVAPYITCKVLPLIQSYFVGDMLCRTKNTLDLDRRLNRGGVVLVNLDKGLLGHAGSRLLGTLLTAELFSTGLRRGRMERESRPPVNVYIDEFQNFISPTVASMFAEARKFGLRLHVANQTLGQLSRSRDNLRHSVLGNVGNQIFFRVGVQDTGDLEPFFHPFTRGHMQELPNFQAFARLMTCNGPLRPFIMRTLPDV